MPDCNDILVMLSGHLDQDLPQHVCAAIRSHLDRCSTCAGALKGLQGTVALCHQYATETRPTSLSAETHEVLLQAFQRALVQTQK